MVLVGSVHLILGVTGSPQPQMGKKHGRGGRSAGGGSTTMTSISSSNSLFQNGQNMSFSGVKSGNETYFNDNGEICNADGVVDGVGVGGTVAANGSSSSSSSNGSGTGLTLPKCRKLEIGDIKKHSLLMIKQEILRKLRLDESRLPNVSAAGMIRPPCFLIHL